MKKKLLLVGIGGYAFTYLNPLLNNEYTDCVIVGCVDPYPEACPNIDKIRELNIPLYSDMEDFFNEGNKADLCVISSPIQFHSKQIKSALKYGANVLCEKPLCGDVNDVDDLLKTEKESGKYVGIGYQWSHSDAIQKLKKDILGGAYGNPKLLKTIVLWPRNKDYFKRSSGWAGKLKAKDGTLILDSVANNATAHYLHNIFYVLGDDVDLSKEPKTVNAELFRANDIENYDTCKVDMTFENGAKALYIASHATDAVCEPMFEYYFENGKVVYNQNENDGNIIGYFSDGKTVTYGNPFDGPLNKLDLALKALENPETKAVCGIKTASVHTKIISKIQEFEINEFPTDKFKTTADDSAIYIEGLYDELMNCYETAEA